MSESPQEWAARNRDRQASRLRKLIALYNDASSPEGEKQAVLAAIERIRQVLTPAQFEQAKAEASAPDAEAFAEKLRQRKSRRYRTPNPAYTYWKRESYSRWETEQDARERQSFADEMKARPRPSDRKMPEAYPDAYGPRKVE